MIRSDEDTDGLASKQHVLRVDWTEIGFCK